jgi:hypothetical protein
MYKCDQCGFEHFSFENCLKTFYFRDEYTDYEWHKIGAYNYRDASERAAKKCNTDDIIVNDFVFDKLEIANHDKSVIKIFKVYAETDIYYSISEIKKGNDNEQTTTYR